MDQFTRMTAMIRCTDEEYNEYMRLAKINEEKADDFLKSLFKEKDLGNVVFGNTAA